MILASPASALTGAKDLDAGKDFFCAVDVAGVKCWGADQHGKATPPNLPKAVAVSAGTDHACAITAEQTVRCWGSNQFGQADPAALGFEIQGAREIAAGSTHSCAIHGAGVSCWGADYDGVLSIPTLSDPHSLDVDGGGACVIDDGQVVCWGRGERPEPPALSNPRLLSDNCAVDDTGLVCWGDHDSANAPSVLGATALSIGGIPTGCAIKNRQPICWSFMPFPIDQPPALERVTAIATNDSTACAISGGQVVCWGYGGALAGYGLGSGDANRVAFDDVGAVGCVFEAGSYRCFGENAPKPGDGFVAADTQGPVVDASARSYGLVCWIDDRGLLCQDRDGLYPISTPVKPAQVDIGGGEACVVYGGNLRCLDSSAPENGLGDVRRSGVSDISLGNSHGCAVTDGQLRCWGSNSHGQAPELAYDFDPQVVSVATGSQFTCIIHRVYGIECFGAYTTYGATESDGVTSPPHDLLNPSEIAGGSRHACAIDDSGVRCWGEGRSGQTVVPDGIDGPHTLTLSAEGSCVFDSLDKLHCWGALDGIGQGNVPDTRRCLGRYVTVDLTRGQSPTEGDDVIWGTNGSDTIFAGEGDDRVCANLGQDSVYGEGGNDHIQLGGSDSRADGGDGDDWLRGTAHRDYLDGGAGNDRLLGLDGDDYLYGSDGDDSLYGGAGNDDLYGAEGSDLLSGSSGDDHLSDYSGNNRLIGGGGDDYLVAGDGDDLLNGGSGNDRLSAGGGHDRLYGQGGADELSGEAGNDVMSGGSGYDNLSGGAGDDTLTGGSGQDRLFGDDGNDWIAGGDANDVLDGGVGDDVLRGGAGNDTLRGGIGADELTGGAGLRDVCVTDNPATGDIVSPSCDQVTN